jgi:hypothetical protein
MKRLTTQASLFLIILTAPAAPLAAEEHQIGAFQFAIPENWTVTKEGASFFAFAPDKRLYISGMKVEGMQRMEQAKAGTLYVCRDMFTNFTLGNESSARILDDREALLITGKGSYKGLDSLIHVLIGSGPAGFTMLYIFGSSEAWTENLILISNIFTSLGFYETE